MRVADFLVRWDAPAPSEVARRIGVDHARGFADVAQAAELARLAEPRDEFDTLATCPRCRCMGHHLVTEVTFRNRPGLRGADGEWIDVSGFGDPPDGTKVAWRQCVFCDNRWGRACR